MRLTTPAIRDAKTGRTERSVTLPQPKHRPKPSTPQTPYFLQQIHPRKRESLIRIPHGTFMKIMTEVGAYLLNPSLCN